MALLVTWCVSKIWPPPVAEKEGATFIDSEYAMTSRRNFLLSSLLAAAWSAFRFVVPRAWAQTEPDMLTIRSDEDIDRILPSLTNWGRWGRRISSAP